MAVGWKITRQIPIFPPHSAPSALHASLKPKDQPRSLVGIVLALKGCAFPYRSPRGPLQQGGTAGTKRLICGAYHGFSTPPALQASLNARRGALATRRNGWDKTADMRSISWLFRTSGFASELEAGGPAMLPHRDCARPEGLRIPVALAAGPLQQGGTAGTKRLICGAYHGFSTPPALQASLKKKSRIPKECSRFFRCGEIGIRTRDTILSYTRFPGVPLKPLEHLS